MILNLYLQFHEDYDRIDSLMLYYCWKRWQEWKRICIQSKKRQLLNALAEMWLKQDLQKRTSVLKYAPSAIHSLLVSKSWLTQAAALICLRSAMVFKRNNVQGFFALLMIVISFSLSLICRAVQFLRRPHFLSFQLVMLFNARKCLWANIKR